MHASTWVSAGLGVALGGFGRTGGWGLWWCLCWGLGARVGGEGSDVVMEFLYSAPTASSTSTKPREATTSKPEARFWFLRLHVHESREEKRFKPLADTRGRNLGPKITAGGNSECRRQWRDSIPTEIYSREFDLLFR